jgi:hypothetical protein
MYLLTGKHTECLKPSSVEGCVFTKEVAMSSYQITSRFRETKISAMKYPQWVLVRRLTVVFWMTLVGLLVMLFLNATAHLAYANVLSEATPNVDTRSSLQADYALWEPTVFHPIMPELLDELSQSTADEFGSLTNFTEPDVIEGTFLVIAGP